MSLECNTDKQDQDLVALLICGVRAAESTKSKLCSLELIRWNEYFRESAYQQRGGPLCWEQSTSLELRSMLHAPLHSSDEGRQGAGHKLCYHFTLSGLSCMNMQSHSIIGVLSHRIHQSSSQWWAINGKLMSDHVRSFLEVVGHIVWSLSKSYICLCMCT